VKKFVLMWCSLLSSRPRRRGDYSTDSQKPERPKLRDGGNPRA